MYSHIILAIGIAY